MRRTNEPRTQRVVSSRTAFWVSDVLSDAEARAFIFGRGGSLELPFPVAVKTGTSQAYHDNWTIGYTHDVTVGVWVGNFDRKPLRNSSGVTGAAPIFHDVMLAAHARVKGSSVPFTVPGEAALDSREICALSGMTPNAWCPSRRREWMPPGARSQGESPVPCSWHHLTEEGLEVIWPPAFRQWAQQQRFVEGARAEFRVRPSRVAARAASAASLEISSPPSGATYLIDPDAPAGVPNARAESDDGSSDRRHLVDQRPSPGNSDV